MKKRILIAYGSRFGATKGVAEKLSSILAERGYDACLVDLANTPPQEWPQATDFVGLVVGSSIKMGRWMNAPRSYLAKNRDHLQGDTPLGVFVCSGFAGDPERQPGIRQEYVAMVLAKLGIQAGLYDAFGGVIDLTKSSAMGWLDGVMMRRVAKKDPAIKQNERNDFRDWNQITEFGEKFAELVARGTADR